jgi:signal transduction histidine kinase
MLTDIIKILVIEDNPGDARLIREMLKESSSIHYEITHLTKITSLRNSGSKAYDIVLLDLNYDDIGGLKSYQYASRFLGHIPIIVLTGLNDDDLGYELVKRGAQDYLIKGEIDSKNLVRSIRYSIERKKSQSILKIARGQNRALKNTASLLRKESERLREINKTKDEFISLASHQLRTPATIVKQYLAMLQGNYAGELGELQRDFIQKAYESNEKQLHIVEDILSVARLDGSNNVIDLVPCDLRPLIEDAVDSIRDQTDSKKQTIVVTLPTDKTIGRVDSRQFRMVVENILENASHYSDEDTTIKIDLVPANNKIEVKIADQGVGIDESGLSKLFQKFSRIPNKYSIQTGGTGLGLYWANKTVKLHKGRIQVSSMVGVGTTFVVSIPSVEQKTSIEFPDAQPNKSTAILTLRQTASTITD